MISPSHHASGALAAKLAEEYGLQDVQALRLHQRLDEFAEAIRREADKAAVERMSRPTFSPRLLRAEERAGLVRNLDSSEGLLAMELAWACEELRKTDGARAAPAPPPPGRVHEVMVYPDGSLRVRSCTDRVLCPAQEGTAFPGRRLHSCPGCQGLIVQVPG